MSCTGTGTRLNWIACLTRLNDYIHVQNQVYETLLKEGFFGENNRRTVTNKDSGKVIEIGKPGIMETFGKGNRYKNLPRVLKDLKLASVRLLPDMLENGTILDPDTKNKHKKNSSLYSYIRGDLTVDGTTYPVYIDIRQSPQKNRFWVHSIRTNESQLLEAGSEITDNDAINEQLTSADDHTISDGKVNPQSGGMASTEIDTDYLFDVNSGDMETARRQADTAKQTPWQRYLRQYEKEREIEKALKTVEILGTVPEEFAELLEEAPGTDALVALRHWEDRRRRDN